MELIGHNGGPSVAEGESWRRHCWAKARADLLPTLPIEVLRTRVRRAKDLGLEYRTYASVRAATGHDVVAFLFSSNALRVTVQAVVPRDRAEKLMDLVDVRRIGLALGRLDAGALGQANPDVLDAAYPAPGPWAKFGEAARILRVAMGRISGDRVLLVGDTTLERDWCAAGRLAGFLTAERYFGAV